jgi:hypothetical protein
MAIMTERNARQRHPSRRGAVRTALILAAVVALVYMSFIGRAVFQYFAA